MADVVAGPRPIAGDPVSASAVYFERVERRQVTVVRQQRKRTGSEVTDRMQGHDFVDPVGSCIADFRKRRVLVMGDAILDEYLVGDCTRISPEAPVPVLKVGSTRQVLGGAANTAANVVTLGGAVTLIAMIGDDDSGQALTQCSREAGVDFQPVNNGGTTLRKTRVVGHQQQIVRLDYEKIRPLSAGLEAAILDRLGPALDGCDIVVVSDYAKGFLSQSLARQIISRAHQRGRQVVIDPRPQHRDCYIGCDYLTPNWRESRALLGLGDVEPRGDSIDVVARTLSSELQTNVVLTLGPHGIAFCSRDGREQFALPTMAREVFDVSGAGDTVVAALSLALASGSDHASAVTIANRAAGVVVGKFGTATVTPEEITQDIDSRRLIPRLALAQLAATLRAQGKRIATINGSFDLLHSGHLHILNEARRQGDVLIVGLISDASVASYKGPNRPIVPERQRAEMLLSLRMVDYVHIFDTADPTPFLGEVKPDVHVNGSAYGENRTESALVETIQELA